MIGDYLRTKRLERGLSQVEVAKSLGYTSAQFVSNWERGISRPPITTILQLSKIYGIDLAELKQIYIDSELDDYRKAIEKRFANA